MIAFLSGSLISKSPESVVIDTGGVGYEVFIPLSTYCHLPLENTHVSLIVHTHLKEDAITLYGFLTPEEKALFKLLISVSGVGPRLARNILSGISAQELASCISRQDQARLSSIPGIGNKSAERLIVELKDKIKNLPEARNLQQPDKTTDDVVSALGNLGYKPQQAEHAIKAVKAHHSGAGFEDLLKESLKVLSRK